MSWQHLQPSSTPVCSVSIRCRCGFHRWLDMGTLPGMGKRGVSKRRGCQGCGLIQIWQCGWLIGGNGAWAKWGYVALENIRYGYDPIGEAKVLHQFEAGPPVTPPVSENT